MRIDLRGIGKQPERRQFTFVDIEWSVRNGTGTWSIYDNYVRDDIAERVIKTLNTDDKLFHYRIKPKTESHT